jgi:tetratricopeptide (TPR) repeat protein
MPLQPHRQRANRRSPSDTSRPSPVAKGVIALAIGGAAALAYSNSIAGVFVLDDVGAILDNPTLRHLGKVSEVLNPPGDGLTVSGRPILNLSFALNYACGGTAVAGYHVTNLVIHACSALVLFLLLGRILERANVSNGAWIAGGAALLWGVHPLQTEAVTYVVQRAESLMSLLFLTSAYAFVRLVEGRRTRSWTGVCAGAFILALATKENAISLLPILFLYDVMFGAGSLSAAWKTRGRMYMSLTATALVEAGILVWLSGRGGQAGFGAEGNPFSYVLTQPSAVLTYLKLAVFPSPLIFEYGVIAPPALAVLALQLVVMAALLAGTVFALVRHSWVGFAMACFWLLLAPTSLVPGTTQMIVEHRMYLALAPLLTLAVIAAVRWLRPAGALVLVLAMAVVFSAMTWRRNQIYRDDITLWSDTVAKRPGNVLAHHNLGTALAQAMGRQAEAIQQYRIVLRQKPMLPRVHGELGALLLQDPASRQEALEELRMEVKVDPGSAEGHDNLARALAMTPGNQPEAVAEFAEVTRLDPSSARAESNLGEALRQTPGQNEAAVEHFRKAIALDPEYAEAHGGLGVAYAMLGQPATAEVELRKAIELAPTLAQARYNLGVFLSGQAGREQEAVASLEEAVHLEPDFTPAHMALARLRSGGALRSNTPTSN